MPAAVARSIAKRQWCQGDVAARARRLTASTFRMRSFQYRGPAFETRRRPMLLAVVIRVDGDGPLGQHHPGLLRSRIDVDVGRQPVGLVERADANEANRVAGSRVV